MKRTADEEIVLSGTILLGEDFEPFEGHLTVRDGVVAEIGSEKVEALNNNNAVRKFDIPYLQRIKSIFTRKARALEKRRSRQQEAA